MTPALKYCAAAVAMLCVLTVVTAEAARKAPTVPPEVLKQYDRLMGDGVLNNGLGRFRLAENAFRAAYDLCERAFGYGRPQCGESLLRLALEISNQGRFVEADLMFRRVGRLIPRKGQPLAHARLTTYRAIHYANRGRHKPAFDMVIDANKQRKTVIKAALRRSGGADAPTQRRLETAMADLAHGLFTQAGLAYQMGRIKEAQVTAHLSRRLIARVDSAPNWWLAFVDELLAMVDRHNGHHAAAEKRLKLALKTKEMAFGNTRPVAMTRLVLGSVYIQSRRSGIALATMRPGLAIVRSELDRAPGVTLEQVLPFLKAAHAEAARQEPNRAALYAEMFGASQLMQSGDIARSLARMAARYSTRDPKTAGLVRRVQALVQNRDILRLGLGQAAISMGGKPDMKEVHRLRAAYARAAGEAADAERDLLEAFPDYASFVSGLPVAARELEGILRPDEALVRFVVGSDTGFAFVYRGDRLHVARLAITRTRLNAAIRALRAPFEKAGLRIPAFDVAAAHRLYRDMFAPIEAHLRGVRHIVSVSTGPMLSLPLSLLVTKPPHPGATDYRAAAWFAKRASFSYMPSVRAFVALRLAAGARRAAPSFVGFGAPSLHGRPGQGGMDSLVRHCQVGKPIPTKLIRGLTALPETRRELRAVAKAVNAKTSRLYLGAQANEPALRSARLEKYNILYFATHGLLPGELRCQSEPALVLTPPRGAASGKLADGLLDASEIAGLKLDADLVVLSACNTGGGGKGPLGGGALSGLSQAFFQAGARSLIVSHWQVDSKATARLMIATFQGLQADGGISYSEALRKAQLSLIGARATSHPFFWAAFTYIGAAGAAAGT